MALPTALITNNLKLKVGATEYACEITALTENITTTGGDEIRTACGVLKTPLQTSITGMTVTLVQNLESSGLFQYMRANVSAGTEVLTWSFGTSYTQSATNPIWTATLTSWTKPPASWSAEGGYPTTTVEFTFTADPVVDYTP